MKRLILALAFVFLVGLSSMISGFSTNAYANDGAQMITSGSYQTVAWHRHWRHRHWRHRHWRLYYGNYGYYYPYYPYR